MDPSSIRGNPIIAGAGVLLMLLGLQTKSWFTASIGADLNFGLTEVKFCHPLVGSCMSIEFSEAQVTGLAETPAYFTLGPMTYYLGLLTVVFVLIAAGLRLFRDTHEPAKGAAVACVAMVILSFVTVQSFPSEMSAPGMGGPSVGWSPFVFLFGALLAAVGSYPPKEDSPQRSARTESGPRVSVSTAQFGIARDPSMIRPERERTPASGIAHIELPPDEPPKPVIQRHRSGSVSAVVSSTGERPSVDPRSGTERVRYASATACIDPEGITSTNHTGDVWRLEWDDIIAVVVRRLPTKEDAPDGFIMDLVGDYIAEHLPKPLRIVRDTEVNWEVLPTGGTRDRHENLRRLVGFIVQMNPELQLDDHTLAFFTDGVPPKQFRFEVEFQQYDLRYGG